MKLRQVTRNKTITETVNGREVHYTQPYTETVPAIPFNLDSLLRRALFLLAICATAGAIIWGTVAIGSMLSLLAPQWAAYAVAGVFDTGWVSCLIAEYLMRYDDEKAAVPRRVGYTMLIVSMSAITLHGHIEDALLVGIVGAFVSAAAKGMWAMGMHVTRVKLAPKYQAYLREMEQETGAQLALAQKERDRTLTEGKAVSLRVALEAQRGPDTKAEQVTEPFAKVPEHVLAASANTPATSGFAVPEPLNIAERARELLANGSPNKDVVTAILADVPTANKESVAATVRRERKKIEGPYL